MKNPVKSYLNSSFNLSELPDVFDELPLWAAPFGLRLLEKINYRKNSIALDIGFGTGFPLTELAMRLGSSATVYGIDPWSNAIQRAQKKIAYYGIRNIHLMEGAAESIPLADNLLDLIVSNNGINNVANIPQVFSECARLLKPGGQFVQTFNTSQTMAGFYSALDQALAEKQQNEAALKMHKHIAAKRPPISFWESLYKQYGFHICSFTEDSFAYRFSDAAAFLNHYFIRLAFMDAWREIIPNELTNDIFDRVENILNETIRPGHGLTLHVPFVVIDAVKK